MTPAAHRHNALRFWLAAVAATEAGASIAIVGEWTPGRAAVAAAALGLGASAAFAAVVLMGTTRPIGRWLRAAMRVVLVTSFLAPMTASSWADPTQARVPDLALSVTCTVSPDATSVAAHADFSWRRLDVWPEGLAGSSGTDSMAIYPELPEWIDSELAIVEPDGYPPPLVSTQTMDPGPWSAGSQDSDSRTLDGRPTGDLLAATASPEGSISMSPQNGPGFDMVGIRNAALRIGGRYEVTWSFQRDPNYAPERSNRELLPVFVVEYQHLNRFTVQALGSCADPNRTFPSRSADWLQY